MSNPGALSDEEQETIKEILKDLQKGIRELANSDLNEETFVLDIEYERDVEPRYRRGVQQGWDLTGMIERLTLQTDEHRWEIEKEKM